jgi:hypothetical protein
MADWDFTSSVGGAPYPDVAIDTSKVHTARLYDYLLGGKTNFPADRAGGEALKAAFPDIVSTVIACRRLLHRIVRFSVGEAGVRQVLDIGTGIPTPPNVHEIAQGIDPTARIVYVDNDRCKSGCTHALGSTRV